MPGLDTSKSAFILSWSSYSALCAKRPYYAVLYTRGLACLRPRRELHAEVAGQKLQPVRGAPRDGGSLETEVLVGDGSVADVAHHVTVARRELAVVNAELDLLHPESPSGGPEPETLRFGEKYACFCI